MALSYTQKTSDNSLITKYVRNYRPVFFLVDAHTTCVDRKPCTTSSALTLSRTVCTRQASFPPTVTLANWRIRRILPSRCAFHLMSKLVDPPTYDLDPTSSPSLSSRSRLHLRSSEFSEMAKRANSLAYVALSSSTAEVY